MAKSSARGGPERFSFKWEKGSKARVESIRALTSKSSETEVLRDAFSVYEAIVTATKLGKRFAVEDPKTGEKTYIWVLPGPAPFSKS